MKDIDSILMWVMIVILLPVQVISTATTAVYSETILEKWMYTLLLVMVAFSWGMLMGGQSYIHMLKKPPTDV